MGLVWYIHGPDIAGVGAVLDDVGGEGGVGGPGHVGGDGVGGEQAGQAVVGHLEAHQDVPVAGGRRPRTLQVRVVDRVDLHVLGRRRICININISITLSECVGMKGGKKKRRG